MRHWGGAFLRRWKSGESGAAAIEFAIVGPLFIAMLCGIIFFGIYLFNSNRVGVAARDAAQLAMLMDNPTAEEVEQEVNRVFAELALDGTRVQVSVEAREDGGREAVIVAAYTMESVTAYFDTNGMGHRIDMRVPLQD